MLGLILLSGNWRMQRAFPQGKSEAGDTQTSSLFLPAGTELFPGWPGPVPLSPTPSTSQLTDWNLGHGLGSAGGLWGYFCYFQEPVSPCREQSSAGCCPMGVCSVGCSVLPLLLLLLGWVYQGSGSELGGR